MLVSFTLLPAHNAPLLLLRLRQIYLSGACSIAFCFVHPFAGKAAYCLSHRHPGSATDFAHIVQLHRVCLPFILPIYTQFSCTLSPTHLFSGRDAVTEYKPYSPVSLHYMPHISTLQVVYDVIFLVIMSSAMCKVLQDGGYGWQYFRCFLCLIQSAHSASCMSTLYHSPHLLLFVLGQPCRGI